MEPLLYLFSMNLKQTMHNIVNHPEAKLLLVGDMVWEKPERVGNAAIEGILMMNDFTLLVSRSERLTYAREHLNEMFGKKYPKNFRKEHMSHIIKTNRKNWQLSLYFGNNEIIPKE